MKRPFKPAKWLVRLSTRSDRYAHLPVIALSGAVMRRASQGDERASEAGRIGITARWSRRTAEEKAEFMAWVRSHRKQTAG